MKLLLWFPNPKDYPYLVAEVRYPKGKSELDKMRPNDYVDLTENEARELIGPSVSSGRFRLVKVKRVK